MEETNAALNGFDAIFETLATFKQCASTLQSQIRVLEKGIKKEIKSMQKEINKKSKTGKKKPSGFAIPSKVTDELCEFMGRDKGCKIARTDATKFISKYIKEKHLQDKEDRRVIIPDEPLKKLLKIGEYDELTYFNLQKHMNKHFVKSN